MIAIDALRYARASGFTLAIPHLRVPAGGATAIVGPSGCGKSTLLALIAGILVPAGGRVRVGEIEVSALDDAARRAFRGRHVGQVFQDFDLVDYLDVFDNIVHPLRLNPALTLDAAARRRARDLATATGLAALLRRRPDALSQGERQRVALCRALVGAPSLLLADEPTGSLDPAAAGQALDLLVGATREVGTTTVVVTHDHGLLPRFDHVIDLPRICAPS